MMKVRFLLDHPGYPVGSVATVTADGTGLRPGVAEQLRLRGIVKPIQTQPKRQPKRKTKQG